MRALYMPRTAVFYETLKGAFGDKLCPIKHSPADELEGAILTVDGLEGTPFACKSLLRWMDQKGTNPMTRLPLTVDMLHPVMTRSSDMDAYAQMVGSLARRGWMDRAYEMEDDVRRRCGWLDRAYEIEDDVRRRGGGKRTREEERRMIDVHAAYSRGADLRDWWRFTQSADKGEAMRHIDRMRLYPTLAYAVGRDGLFERLSRFLIHRKRLWRFPRDEREYPIYLKTRELSEDFRLLYSDAASYSLDSVQRMLESVAVNSEEADDHVIAHIDHGRSMAIVLYPPTFEQWLCEVILPEEVDNSPPERWRRPQALRTIENRLWALIHDDSTKFEISHRDIAEALAHFMTRTDNVRFYSLPTRPFDAAGVDARLREAITLCVNDDRTPRLLKPSIEFVHEIRLRLPDLMGDVPTDAEICAAVEGHFDESRDTGYHFSEEGLRRVSFNPLWLPSNPYENPRLLVALKYGLEGDGPQYE